MILRRPPQAAHWLMSTENTRASGAAHPSRWPQGCGPGPGAPGHRGKSRRWSRGGGTSAASFSSSSRGESWRWLVPSAQGVLSAKERCSASRTQTPRRQGRPGHVAARGRRRSRPSRAVPPGRRREAAGADTGPRTHRRPRAVGAAGLNLDLPSSGRAESQGVEAYLPSGHHPEADGL